MHGFWGRPPAWLPAILAYHKIGTREWGGTWCSRSQFVAHLEALGDAGYRCLDLQATLQHVTCRTDARRRVLLTFDDAFESFADTAWPELRQRGMQAVLFVISGFAGRSASWDLPLPGRRVRHLSWSALRDLAADGVEIGSHTVTHADVRRLGSQRLLQELRDSRQHIEDALGVAVRAVSWPFGRCSEAAVRAAHQAGYELGFGMSPRGRNDVLHPLALPRRGVYVTDRSAAVLDKIDPQRSGFWFQDLFTRGVGAVAELSTLFQKDG
jgi:peptidoglycan/xylan/chitin deacetylase (PgdA/CDA1 family)